MRWLITLSCILAGTAVGVLLARWGVGQAEPARGGEGAASLVDLSLAPRGAGDRDDRPQDVDQSRESAEASAADRAFLSIAGHPVAAQREVGHSSASFVAPATWSLSGSLAWQVVAEASGTAIRSRFHAQWQVDELGRMLTLSDVRFDGPEAEAGGRDRAAVVGPVVLRFEAGVLRAVRGQETLSAPQLRAVEEAARQALFCVRSLPTGVLTGESRPLAGEEFRLEVIDERNARLLSEQSLAGGTYPAEPGALSEVRLGRGASDGWTVARISSQYGAGTWAIRRLDIVFD